MRTSFLVLAILVVLPTSAAYAGNVASSPVLTATRGRLLLQVEDGGRIWYVSPTNDSRYEVTFANALPLFQKLALGISNADLKKIPTADDSKRGDAALTKRLKGRLLLQVEDGGRIWYVSPTDTKRHEVTWANLMPLFRSLALGITNANLDKITNSELSVATIETAPASALIGNESPPSSAVTPSNPVQTQADVCSNIEGLQTVTPTGMTRNGFECTVPPLVTPSNPAPSTALAAGPKIVSFAGSQNGTSITLSWESTGTTICTVTENKDITVPFDGHLPSGETTFTPSTGGVNGAKSYYLTCADKDWNTVQQAVSVPYPNNTISDATLSQAIVPYAYFVVINLRFSATNPTVGSIKFEIIETKTGTITHQETISTTDQGGNYHLEVHDLKETTEYKLRVSVIQSATWAGTAEKIFSTVKPTISCTGIPEFDSPVLRCTSGYNREVVLTNPYIYVLGTGTIAIYNLQKQQIAGSLSEVATGNKTYPISIPLSLQPYAINQPVLLYNGNLEPHLVADEIN